MTQGELFGAETVVAAARRGAGAAPDPPSAHETAADADGVAPDPISGDEVLCRDTTGAGEEVRRHLQERLGLWVDPFTADYIVRAIGRGQEQIEFIASDARSGRSAFHVVPAAKLRSA